MTETHGLQVSVPGDDDRAMVRRMNHEAVVQDRVKPSSRQAYREVVAKLAERWAEAVILRCMGTMLQVKPGYAAVPHANHDRCWFDMPLPQGRSARAASLAVLAASLIGAPVSAKVMHVAISGGRITVTQYGSATSLILAQGRRRLAAELPKDEMVAAGTLEGARLIGMPGRNLALLLTDYASQTGIGGPEVQCAAGEERILRVVALAPSLRQTASMRVASCWDGISGSSMTWAEPSGPLVIDGLGDTPEAYSVDAEGRLRRGPVPAPGDPGKVKIFDLQ